MRAAFYISFTLMVIGLTSPASADALFDCLDASVSAHSLPTGAAQTAATDKAIVVCSNAITAGGLTARDLATAYSARASLYSAKGDLKSEMNDLDTAQAITTKMK